MGFADRDYYRDGPRPGLGTALMWLLNGRLPLGTWFGIPVRMHSLFVIFIAWFVIFPAPGMSHLGTLLGMGILFGIVLLHEFGHLFAARAMGGNAEEILLWPLGGLARGQVPPRWYPNFIMVVGGPLVNVIICLLVGGAMLLLGWAPPVNPLDLQPTFLGGEYNYTYFRIVYYLFWVYVVSYFLLLFNLLPIFPLDGGQIVQTLLWPRVGYYRSMRIACMTGMVGAILLGVYAMSINQWIMLAIAINGLLVCYQLNQQLIMAGRYHVEAAVEAAAAASYQHLAHQQTRERQAQAKRLQRQRQAEQREQQTIDRILQKVSEKGMGSLSWFERRQLRQATERQRQRDSQRRR